jgi:hypothetical protein
MMFGSMLYKSISTGQNPMAPQRVLTCLLAVAALCFFIPGRVRDERITLWCFCIFELCCGFYYPVMASLKGKLIDDGSRASIYGILRVPLNAFVVLALSSTTEGEFYPSDFPALILNMNLGEAHRDLIFTTCSALLIVAATVVHNVLP